MDKCLFDRWMEGNEHSLNRFTQTLFQLFQYADGANRKKIIETWPQYFENSENI